MMCLDSERVVRCAASQSGCGVERFDCSAGSFCVDCCPLSALTVSTSIQLGNGGFAVLSLAVFAAVDDWVVDAVGSFCLSF